MSGLEGENKDTSLVKETVSVSIDIPVHSDVFSNVDEVGVAAESKFRDAPVLLDRQKE